jgi:hypothetical protein
MERDFVIRQLKEEAKKIEKHLKQLEQDAQLTYAEAEQFLQDTEKMYRNLAVYTHTLKQQEIGGDLKVHLKIMQNVAAIEETPLALEKEKIAEVIHAPPLQEEVIRPITEETESPVITEEQTTFRKIEFSINDKFRIINELFFQSQPEFQAALQQINSIHTLEESIFYLDSLKPIYNWKDDNILVKDLYSLVRKRFS